MNDATHCNLTEAIHELLADPETKASAEILNQLHGCCDGHPFARGKSLDERRRSAGFAILQLRACSQSLLHKVRRESRRIKYHGESDSLGRCEFSLTWVDDYHPGHPDGEDRIAERGQHFYSDPRTHGFPRPEEAKKSVKKKS